MDCLPSIPIHRRRPRRQLAWLLALCAGLGEFAGLQAWRLRERLARR